MRHGVPLVALREFLRERFPGGWPMTDQDNGQKREVIVIDD
jgi:hypothetical protein